MIKLDVMYKPVSINKKVITYQRIIKLKKNSNNVLTINHELKEKYKSSSSLHNSLKRNKEVRVLRNIKADYVSFYYKNKRCEFLFYQNRQFHSLEYVRTFKFTIEQYEKLGTQVRKFNINCEN